ncbi:unnamed protein product [Polarella glacialis]|uniref:Uncharacterized protein n=1 Tax=Polarella glacialis TaxID=89957 RepID=A0A813L4D3_POLGL|nr:unnamed protein product [Polarella glacialis]
MQGRELAPGPVMLGRLMTTNTLSKEGTSSKTLEDGNSGLRWADPRLHGLGDRKSEKAPDHDKPLFWALLRVLGCTISTLLVAAAGVVSIWAVLQASRPKSH